MRKFLIILVFLVSCSISAYGEDALIGPLNGWNDCVNEKYTDCTGGKEVHRARSHQEFLEKGHECNEKAQELCKGYLNNG